MRVDITGEGGKVREEAMGWGWRWEGGGEGENEGWVYLARVQL